MRRWVFILIGGVGAGLTALGAFMLWLAQIVEPRFYLLVTLCGWFTIPIGLALCVIGFIQGRRAGELDISTYIKTPRRDYHVDGREIEFQCPICHKSYHASPLLAGKPFTCRECREKFDVPQIDQLTSRPARQADRCCRRIHHSAFPP